jgi:threonine/homoserine/homoserine lactone efflux protein
MAMTAMSTYLPGNAVALQVLLLAGLFVLINAPCVTCWAAFGSSMRRLLQDRFRLRVFNMTMAAALVGSLYPLLKP